MLNEQLNRLRRSTGWEYRRTRARLARARWSESPGEYSIRTRFNGGRDVKIVWLVLLVALGLLAALGFASRGIPTWLSFAGAFGGINVFVLGCFFFAAPLTRGRIDLRREATGRIVIRWMGFPRKLEVSVHEDLIFYVVDDHKNRVTVEVPRLRLFAAHSTLTAGALRRFVAEAPFVTVTRADLRVDQ